MDALSRAAPVNWDMKESSNEVPGRVVVRGILGCSIHTAYVNGGRLYYLAGGRGPAVSLLTGWPEAWWRRHKTIPQASATRQVISIKIRGMGSTSMPGEAHDREAIVDDPADTTQRLGTARLVVVGHDTAAMVVFSFAPIHADKVQTMVMLDVAYPSAGCHNLRLLHDTRPFADKTDERHRYQWWFMCHEVKGLPKGRVVRRSGTEQSLFLPNIDKDEPAIGPSDRAVYLAAYSYSTRSTPATSLSGPGNKRREPSLNATSWALMSTASRPTTILSPGIRPHFSSRFRASFSI
jgi:pimeloyl-ACP methyl ester carboxylesterase